MELVADAAQQFQLVRMEVEVLGVTVIELTADAPEGDEGHIGILSAALHELLAEGGLCREGLDAEEFLRVLFAEHCLGVIHILPVNLIGLGVEHKARVAKTLVEVDLVGGVHKTGADSCRNAVVGVDSKKGNIGSLGERKGGAFVLEQNHAI